MGEESTLDEVEPTRAEEAEGGDEDGAAAPPAAKDRWREALDRYLEGNLQLALELVDQILEEEPDTELRPRLERLRRRAQNRLERRGDDDEAAPGEGEEDLEAPQVAGEEESSEEAPAAATEAAGAPLDDEDEEVGPAVARKDSGSQLRPTIEPGVAAASETPAVEPAPAPAAALEAAAPEVKPESTQSGRLKEGSSPELSTKELAPIKEGSSAEHRVGSSEESRISSGRRRAIPPGPGRSGGAQRRARRPGAPPPADMERLQGTMEKLARTVRGVEGSMVKIAEAYQRVARDGKRKEQAYDQLYEELRQYKDNFLLSAQKPLFKDLILLYDGISRVQRQFAERDEQVPLSEVQESLAHIRDEILEVLYRRDIELIEDAPDQLDIEIQKPIRRIETDDPGEDRMIDSVVRDGFRMDGAVLRPQEVVVKRCLKEREARK